ncbi:hypothetical protein N0V83_002211 [Neocucurbitaria cava]|uniref:Ankyrin n=1 Tax=Neocucurbitaria cava TaxID=798079 RepID=A0A9W9CQK8_9PLEO|nr:hypothetical protein N0V83_002211 [Neocucurbitaria cava]
MKSMFNDPDRLNELHFTNRHRRVLGLPECEPDDPDELAERDIDASDAMGRTSLQWAVLRNDLATVRSLLHSGASPNKPAERSGWTSMHFAARARDLNPAILQLLLEHNGDIDYQDCHSQTPLSRAVRHGVGATKLLIRAGANVNLQYDIHGWSAVLLAAFIGQASCVEVLLEAGADPSLQTSLGSNVVAMAQRYSPIQVLEVFGRFRTIVKPAFNQYGRGLSLDRLQQFRQEKGLSQISDEWWALWTNLVNDLCGSELVFNPTMEQPDSDRKHDEGSDDDEAFEDALESI